MTLIHPSNSFANLIYVGYSGDFGSAFTTMRKRRVDRKKQQTQRNVFQCYVFGPRGAGKTALLQSFLGRCSMHFLVSYTMCFISLLPCLFLTICLRSLFQATFWCSAYEWWTVCSKYCWTICKWLWVLPTYWNILINSLIRVQNLLACKFKNVLWYIHFVLYET